MGSVALQFAGDEVTGDDAARFSIHENQVEHFVAVEHFDGTQGDLAGEGLVRAQEELLSRLAPCIEGTAYLYPSEGAVV